MSDLSMDSLSRSQCERLAYIDFRLYFLGELRRSDISEKFGVGPAGATRDIALYRKYAADNLVFDQTKKVYRSSIVFSPIFSHSLQRALSALTEGFGDIVSSLPPQINCTIPAFLNDFDIDNLSTVTRAIKTGKVIQIRYLSKSSGWSEREIIPSALANSGKRWHVRAYDRKRSEFRDFVLSRISESRLLEDCPARHETNENDDQWNRWVELHLVPHPGQKCKEAIVMDYGITGKSLRIKLRAAVAGYYLRYWNVDCTMDYSLSGLEYDLWLSNPLELYGVKNALIAPGYVVQGSQV